MPIRLNLLAEARAAEEMKRRDPVKLAAWIAGFVIFLVLLWASTVYFQVIMAGSTLQAQQNRWKGMEKNFVAVTDNTKKLGDLQKKLSSLYRFSTNRFLWGSVLNAFQEATVDKIQVDRFKTTQTYLQFAATVALTIAGKTTPAKPPASVEKISFSIDAKDYSDPSDRNFNKFKEKLAEAPYLKRFFTKPESIRLANLLPPGVSALESARSFQSFLIECEFPETKRE